MKKYNNPLVEDFNNNCVGDDAYWLYDFEGTKVLIQNSNALRAIANSFQISDEDLRKNAVWKTNFEEDWLDEVDGECAVRVERVVEGTLSDDKNQILIIGNSVDGLRKVSEPLFKFYDMISNIYFCNLPECLYEEAQLIKRGKMYVDCTVGGKRLMSPRDVSNCYCTRSDVVEAIISSMEYYVLSHQKTENEM